MIQHAYFSKDDSERRRDCDKNRVTVPSSGQTVFKRQPIGNKAERLFHNF
ncbi:predicted protein [Enterococcus faecium Com12]|nr:predicted protein [Enterococcus faecium Com12]